MAFLSSLTDSFTGAPAKAAANQTRGFLDQTLQTGNSNIAGGLATGNAAIAGGAAGARDALGQGFADATNYANSGGNAAINYIDQGTAGAVGRFDQAAGAYQPLSALGLKYGTGTDLYLDSLGINGAEGNARARSSFDAGAGYNWETDQGIDALARIRNAQTGGNGVGGNTDRDASNYVMDRARTAYGGWQDRLGGLVNPELAATSGAASGVAGANTGAAGAIMQGGTSKAGIESGRASMLADLASRYGTGMAGVDQGEGTSLAGLATGAAGQQVGLAQGLSPAYAKTYGDEATAQMQGSSNLWNLGMNAAKLAMTPLGGMGGGAMTMQPNPNGGGLSPMAPARSPTMLSNLFG